MLRKNLIKKKVRRKNPDPSRSIDFNEEQLEEFYNSDVKVLVEYKYGYFYGHLIYLPNTKELSPGYSFEFKTDSIQFVFSPDDVKKIVKRKNDPPVITLK